MLAGDDLGPAPSFLSMAKGKIPSFSQRVIPYCAMDESRNTWENHQDMYVAQKTESDTSPCRLTVGYALTKKKTESFIQPKLLEQTRNKGIHLFPIDSNKELIEQGPFHVILHKIVGKDWRRQLEDYKQKYPNTIIVDSPESIKQLRNRQSMLQAVIDADLEACGGRVGIPRQLVVTAQNVDVAQHVAAEGLKLPLVVKPLVADGTVKSHTMYLAHNPECISSLDPPYVLQEFVNHGGVLFKVYVVGHVVRVVKRRSLPDQFANSRQGDGLSSFSRISSAAGAKTLSESEKTKDLPPQDLLEALASELRKRLGLQLFNIDLIREGGPSGNYFVIDINYFPGYGKVPGYETAFAEFLEKLAKSRRKGFNGEWMNLKKTPNFFPADKPS